MRTASTTRREIETLIETASSEHADVVIGSRFAGKGDYQARGPRKWAMNLFSVILSRVCHTRLSDTTSGFKLYGPRALSLFAHNYPAEYLGDTIGALVIAARSHLVVREVGVQMHPRAGGEPSHNPDQSALFLVRATMALAVSLSRPGEKVAPAPEENAFSPTYVLGLVFAIIILVMVFVKMRNSGLKERLRPVVVLDCVLHGAPVPVPADPEVDGVPPGCRRSAEPGLLRGGRGPAAPVPAFLGGPVASG